MSSQASYLRMALFLAAFEVTSHAQQAHFDELHRMFPYGEGSTEAAVLVDVDGDGDRDVVAGNYYAPDALFLNDGLGIFQASSSSLPADSAATFDLACGDLDADGDVDAFLANDGPSCVYRNDGGAVFSLASGALPVHFERSACVDLGDVDQDGDLDALVGNLQECEVFKGKRYCCCGQDRLYLNDGSGVFGDGPSLPLLLVDTADVSLGDLDGDGDLDALMGNYGPSALLIGDGAGSFTDASLQLPPESADTYALDVADVDGDGDLDAFLATGSGQSLILNDGSGTFADATANLPPGSDQTFDLSLVDADGDGDFDALLGNYKEQDRLYLNDGAGLYVDAPGALPAEEDTALAVCVGDVDGDGDPDALFGGYEGRLCLNDGTGVFGETSSALPHTDPTSAIALGDVDADGDSDAVMVGDYGGAVHLYLNDEAGFFAEVPDGLPSDPSMSSDVALGDVDGDGDPDVLVGVGCFGPLARDRLYLNDGSGVFSDGTAALPGDPDCTNSVSLGDVDQDGDIDVFLGNSMQNRLYLNDGLGVFADAPSALPSDSGYTSDVGLGDLDGNGTLDAVVTNIVGLQNQLLLNHGAVFADASTHLPSHPTDTETSSVALGDVDGDGDLDAWLGTWSHSGGVPDLLYMNDGASFFTDATASLPVALEQTRAVVLRDLDGDDDLDLVMGNEGQNRLLQNDGAGIFTDATSELPVAPGNTFAVAVDDLDGDGDLDIVFGNYYSQPSRVFSNLSRQVAWRGLARVGKPLAMDLYGTPNAPWSLAWSLGAASISLPPLGDLLLDPAHAFVTGPGVLDAEGRASQEFLVPGNPTLLGVKVRWQALLGDPLLFSNLELTQVTAF